MKQFFRISATTALLCLPAGTPAQDVVYPSGSGVTSTYSVSATQIVIGDTLEIRCALTNGSGDLLRNLYFSDCLPPSFDLAGSSITVDDVSIDFGFEGPILNDVIADHRSYRWIIDSPISGENLVQPVAPGDSVVLIVRVVPSDLGQFDLPLHCAAFLTTGGGFAVSQPQAVSVTVTSSVDDDPHSSLPGDYLTSLAYPNPFNGEVKISYSGLRRTGLTIQVSFYNSLGQKVDELEIESADTWGRINWSPGETIGSGLYLYRISTGNQAGSGKIVLLK
jgi:uncharacterized repeat protein (TIGR01451 family)